MEYGLGKLEEMSRMEYGAANKDELVAIRRCGSVLPLMATICKIS